MASRDANAPSRYRGKQAKGGHHWWQWFNKPWRGHNIAFESAVPAARIGRPHL
jgi:hypothetical protein